jgi:hypothetical protein
MSRASRAHDAKSHMLWTFGRRQNAAGIEQAQRVIG